MAPSANQLLDSFLIDPEEAVVGFRLDGSVFLWNCFAETLYGYAAGEITGRPVDCLFPAREFPAVKESLGIPHV